MACVTRHAALMSVSLASWRSCAKMRSSWTHWKSGTASSARRCDTSCMGDNFSHHCACNLVDHSHRLKVFPLHGCALVQLPDLGLLERPQAPLCLGSQTAPSHPTSSRYRSNAESRIDLADAPLRACLSQVFIVKRPGLALD